MSAVVSFIQDIQAHRCGTRELRILVFADWTIKASNEYLTIEVIFCLIHRYSGSVILRFANVRLALLPLSVNFPPQSSTVGRNFQGLGEGSSSLLRLVLVIMYHTSSRWGICTFATHVSYSVWEIYLVIKSSLTLWSPVAELPTIYF